MPWFHGVFCPCSGRKTRSTTSNSAQQQHSNSNHDFETTLFFIFLQNSTQLALGITATTHHHSLVSSRQNASKKKQSMKKETKGPAVMMTHPYLPSRITTPSIRSPHHMRATSIVGSLFVQRFTAIISCRQMKRNHFHLPKRPQTSNMTRRRSPSTSSFSASQARSNGPEE